MRRASALETIKSTANPRYKLLKSLTRRRIREREGLYIAEGYHLVGEALRSGAFIDSLFVSPRAQSRAEGKAMLAQAQARNLKTFELSDEMLAEVSEVEGPEGILAVVRLQYTPLPDLLPTLPADGLLVVVDGLQDPGNLGTIIRTAHATGAAGIIVASDTVDPFNGKTLRAAMGSHFHLPLARATDDEIVTQLRTGGVRLVVADPRAAEAVWEADLSGRIAFILGNEGAGPGRQLLRQADLGVVIPMPGRAESLNVAVAGAMLLYEAMRQRA